MSNPENVDELDGRPDDDLSRFDNIELMRIEVWWARYGGSSRATLFLSESGLRLWVRKNRDKLSEMGAIAYNSGRRGILLRDDFGRYAMKLVLEGRRGMTNAQRLKVPLPAYDGAISGPVASDRAAPAPTLPPGPVSTPSEPPRPAALPTAALPTAATAKAAAGGVVKPLPAWRAKMRQAEGQS